MNQTGPSPGSQAPEPYTEPYSVLPLRAHTCDAVDQQQGDAPASQLINTSAGPQSPRALVSASHKPHLFARGHPPTSSSDWQMGLWPSQLAS